MTAPPRLVSLDALRGADMLCLLLLDGLVRAWAKADPASPAARFLLSQFTHPQWEGFTFYDLIFPLFEFLVGASVLLSVSRRRERGDRRGAILRHAVVRAGLLWFVGTWVNGGLLTYDPARMRLTYSVLQMLGLASLVATVFVLTTGPRGWAAGCLGLLVGYAALLTFVPLPAEPRTYTGYSGVVHAPAYQPGVFAEGGLVNFWLDEQLFCDWDRWRVGWVLETMGHGATALLGVLAAHVLRTLPPLAVARRLAVAGLGCLATGGLWGLLLIPIIKNLWSSSFVLWAGGWSFLLLAATHAVTDGLGWQRWAYPLRVVGANSLVAYLMAGPFRPVPAAAAGVVLGGLGRYTGGWQPVVLAAGTGLAGWLILRWMFRTRTFVRL